MSEKTISHHDQMKQHILEEYKGNTFALIQKFPFMISEVKSNITAEMRDYIIENHPQYAINIPNCYITTKSQDDYVISMLKKGNHPYSIKQIGESKLSYKSAVILLKSGFYSPQLVYLSKRERTKFLSAIIKLFRTNKDISSTTIWELSNNYGESILKYYNTIERELTGAEVTNLYNLINSIALHTDTATAEILQSRRHKNVLDKIFDKNEELIFKECYHFYYDYLHAKFLVDNDFFSKVCEYNGINTHDELKEFVRTCYRHCPVSYILSTEKIIKDVNLNGEVKTIYWKDTPLSTKIHILISNIFNKNMLELYIKNVVFK